MLPVIKMAINRRGGLYVNGNKLPPMYRERVLDLYHENVSQRQIAQLTRTSLHFVQNVLRDYDVTNSSLQHPRAAYPRPKMTRDVVDFIEMEKLLKPSTYSSEIHMARNPIQSAADVRAQDVFRFPYKYWQEKGRIDF